MQSIKFNEKNMNTFYFILMFIYFCFINYREKLAFKIKLEKLVWRIQHLDLYLVLRRTNVQHELFRLGGQPKMTSSETNQFLIRLYMKMFLFITKFSHILSNLNTSL